jgi:hypothetical protein
MKVKIKIEKEVELKTLQVKAGVRYWEDTIVSEIPDTEYGDNIPCKNGDLWMPEIEIETGKILNWKQGETAEVHYKVCDCCGWELKDETGSVVLSEDNGYVPDTLSPKVNGYGDYIIMDIDENGMIADWYFDIEDFQKEEND